MSTSRSSLVDLFNDRQETETDDGSSWYRRSAAMQRFERDTSDQCRLTAGFCGPSRLLSTGTKAMGIDSEMTAPPPGGFDNTTVPPCAVTTAWTNARPSPCPVECSPFTKRSKARLRSSGGKPG